MLKVFRQTGGSDEVEVFRLTVVRAVRVKKYKG
jgi:hypothetical protein